MRHLLLIVLTFSTVAGFAGEPATPPEEEKLTSRELVRKLGELNAFVVYSRGAPQDAVIAYVAINDTWKGGDEGLELIERLARSDESFRVLYIIGQPDISAERIKELQSAAPRLNIQRRSAAHLGVAGGIHPRGIQLIKVAPGSPAEKAGLRDWDVLTEFGGTRPDGFEALVKEIASRRPGDEVEVKFLRGEEERTTRVKLEGWSFKSPNAAEDRDTRRPRAPRLEGFGHVEGRFLLGGDVPQRKAIVRAGRVCGPQHILDESLVVDSESKGIANIFVYLRRADEVHPDLRRPPAKPAVVEIENCAYKPHALFVRSGQPVLIKSGDAFAHVVHTHPILSQEENVRLGPDGRDSARLQFDRSEILPSRITCDVHPHEVAYCLALDHPYAAVTDAKGHFRIENLPTGEHKLTVWHERVGYLDRALEVTIQPGKTASLEPVTVPVERLQPGAVPEQ